ncbi:MAG: hypothetical protein ACI9WU_003744 [Myxococcota bacterium]|jgi:hypothetical protein
MTYLVLSGALARFAARARFAALVVLLSASLAEPASAYVQYTTSDDETRLRWFSSQIDIWYDNNPPVDLTESGARTAIENAYQRWSSLTCSGVSSPFTFDFVGDRACTVGFDDTQGAVNESCVIWVTNKLAWIHGDSVLALTSLTFNDVTGEIIDADLELNDAGFEFVTGGCVPPRIDLANTVVHEAGHVLGLHHSKESEATMHSMAPPCETKKADLHQDDIDGYCAMYGPDAPLKPTPAEPDTGGGGSGCCIQAGQPGAAGMPGSLAVVLLLLAGLARGASSARRRGR